MFPKLVKEIRSKTGELHFCRWRIIETRWFNIYIHLIAKADEDKHEHSHPWNFISITLLGGYEETNTTYKPSYHTGGARRDIFKFFGKKPFISRVTRDTFHKVTKLFEPTLTLVFTGKRYDDWYYDIDGKYLLDNTRYRQEKEQGLI